jgi:hypothetical protein
MTAATGHHTEIGSDREAKLAAWACVCGESEVINFERYTGEAVARRLVRIQARRHLDHVERESS